MAEVSIVELEDVIDEIEAPPMLPRGWYEASITSLEERTSEKGNEYYNIGMTIPPSQFPPDGDYAEFFPDGVILYYNRMLVPKANDRRTVYRVAQFMKKLGVRTNTSTVDPTEWLGVNLRVRINHGEWEGEPRMEIGGVEASEEAAPAPTPKSRRKR
jgi:hypothetical protein